MATESFLVTALPHTALPTAPFHVSLFVAHRLTPSLRRDTLNAFPLTRDWTRRLSAATVRLRGGTAAGAVVDLPCTPLFEALDPSLWPAIFPADLPVRAWTVQERTAAPWRTFAAHRMQTHALLTHVIALVSSPVTPPTVRGNALTAPLLRALGVLERGLDLERILTRNDDAAISKRLDEIAATGMRREFVKGLAENPLLQMVADVHAARRFYQRDRAGDNPYRAAPDPAFEPEPISNRAPDFHERAAQLGDLAPLLRKLGLVIDVKVRAPEQLQALTWIQGDVLFEGVSNPQAVQPRTSCRVVGHAFTPVSATGDYSLGLLRVGDEQRFTVLDLDPDASALKLEQYVRTVPRLYAAEANGDPVHSAPASLRATGFAVARAHRAMELYQRLQNATAQDAAIRNGTAAPLVQEQVTRGVRLEVWDDDTGRWHSLHHRLLSVQVHGIGAVMDRVLDTAFLQGAALVSADRAPTSEKYAHEVLAGWDGWSLAAPRPGQVVEHDRGNEVLKEPTVPAPTKDAPVAIHSEVAPGTLPRLRYGRRYAFRAYAVDLAGNARPHEVHGAPPGAGSGAGGMALSDAQAADFAATQLQGRQLDATQLLTSRETGELRSQPSDVLRAAARGLRPLPDQGPVSGREVAGVNPGAWRFTDVDAVDRLIASRAERTRPVARAEQIAQLFTSLHDSAPLLLERTDTADATSVAARAWSLMARQQLDLVATRRPGVDTGTLLGLLGHTVTTPRPFLRWDPVIEPTVVPRHAFTEGESLLRLVVRSGVAQAAAGSLDVTITPPAEYVANTQAARPDLNLVWRAESERHLAPPKTSQLDAELHGMFDEAMGPAATPAQVRQALATALRESGSFLDVTIADADTPGARVPQPGVTFHVSPTADTPTVVEPADLPDGDPLTPGQYVAHDVDRVVLPYLPDPLAQGVSLTFPDAGRDHRLRGLLAVNGTTLRYGGAWPDRVPFRLVLADGPVLHAEVDGHVIRVTLPPGEQLRVRLSSSLTPAALQLLGLWRSMPEAVRSNALMREAAQDGWFWWLTPSTELRFVHAVPRPVDSPRITVLVPSRKVDDTTVALIGAVDVHGPSTERLDLEGTWEEWVDDVAKAAPERIAQRAVACGTSVAPTEDLVVLASENANVPLPNGELLRLHEARHAFGDTRRRIVQYTARATTRYREYFPALLTPHVDDLSLVGPARTVDVPSSARPPKVVVREVLPLFRWSAETEPENPFGLRRVRRSGVRLYLDRPWYATGDGELLGVLIANGSDVELSGTVSRWGSDPVFLQQGAANRAQLPLTDLLQQAGLDDRRVPGRPVGPPRLHVPPSPKALPPVWVLGYEPEYSADRRQWYVDIAFDPGAAFWPFVQLAVARYQPNSANGLHLGPVTVCDFVQLAPERTATATRPDDRSVRVVLTGAVGAPKVPPRPPIESHLLGTFVAQVAHTRKVRARLERFDETVGTDLGWRTLLQTELPILGADGTVVSWCGTLELPEAMAVRTPGDSASWRVTLEEWEYLPADTGAGGTGGWQGRIVYADHLPL